MVSETGPLTEDSRDRSIYTGKPRRGSLGRTERTSQDITALTGQQCQEGRGQDCWGRIAGTGQSGQEQLGQDSQRRQSG
jgi:hypothetical protein